MPTDIQLRYADAIQLGSASKIKDLFDISGVPPSQENLDAIWMFYKKLQLAGDGNTLKVWNLYRDFMYGSPRFNHK